jgi:hypothetical protein
MHPGLIKLQLFNTKNILPPEIQGLLTILLLALTLTFFYYVMMKTTPKKGEEPTVTKTILKCMGTGKVFERDFEKGDYVGKIVGKCDENGSTKYIHAIYEVKPEKKSG